MLDNLALSNRRFAIWMGVAAIVVKAKWKQHVATINLEGNPVGFDLRHAISQQEWPLHPGFKMIYRGKTLVDADPIPFVKKRQHKVMVIGQTLEALRQRASDADLQELDDLQASLYRDVDREEAGSLEVDWGEAAS